MALTFFRPRPKPFADRLVNIAVVLFAVGFVGRIAWSFAQ